MLLMLLWEKDNQVVGDITERLLLETNTVTPILQRMEKQGLIIRQKSKADNRKCIVSLTNEGKRLEEQIKEVPNCLAHSIVDDGMEIDDLKAMVPLLDKLIGAIGKQTKQKE